MNVYTKQGRPIYPRIGKRIPAGSLVQVETSEDFVITTEDFMFTKVKGPYVSDMTDKREMVWKMVAV